MTHDGYSGAHAYSEDGATWTVTSPALAYGTTGMWSDGKVRTLSKQERASILLDASGNPVAAYYATTAELNSSTDAPSSPQTAHTWCMAVPLN